MVSSKVCFRRHQRNLSHPGSRVERMFATEQKRAGIPRGLDDMPPGPRLAAILSTIEVELLEGREAVLFARAQQRQISHDQARQYRALSRVADIYIEDSTDRDLYEFAAAETGAALTLTRQAARREMDYANDVIKNYPALLKALETGQVDPAKVRAMIHGVGHVDIAVANKALALLLPDATGLTTGQIAARLRKLVIEADPEEAKKAYEEGLAQARVWSTLEPDGTGTMISKGMEARDLAAANRNINGIARRRKNAGDSRPIDKIRSEVFAQLLNGEIAGNGKRAQVNITGNLATLERLNEKVGHLEGFGPVHADILRQIVESQRDATWTYEITDPETGEVFVGTTSRRPTADQHRQLVARYKTCVHPGCRFAAAQCDIDHIKDRFFGGLTTICNLAPLCRFHHRLKHQTVWIYRKLADGSIEWTSQFGFRYLTHPP
jgi:hypothetical protein